MGLYTIKEIRDITSKDHPGPFYARKVIRKISPYITWLLLHTPITANQTSLLMILVGIVASLLFSFGSASGTLVGALILQLFYILDCVDGEIARCKNEETANGIYLDKLANFVVNPLVFAGITIGLYQQFPSYMLLIFGLIASWSIFLLHSEGSTQLGVAFISLKKKLVNQNKDAELKGQNKESDILIINKTKPHIPPILISLFKRILFLWYYPSVMNIITTAAVLNAFYANLSFGVFETSFMYLVIILYAITLPIICTLVIAYDYIYRTPDRASEAIIEWIITERVFNRKKK